MCYKLILYDSCQNNCLNSLISNHTSIVGELYTKFYLLDKI